jgi:hypothetical protein
MRFYVVQRTENKIISESESPRSSSIPSHKSERIAANNFLLVAGLYNFHDIHSSI